MQPEYNNNVNNNRKLIIIGGLILAVLIFIGFMLTRPKPQSSEPTEKTIVELTGSVVIDNTDGLSDILLSEQYAAVDDALSDFIQTKINKTIQHAVIVNDPAITKGGNVVFSVKTDPPVEKTFQVVLDRSSSLGDITILIPSYSYKEKLKIFSQDHSVD